MLGINCIYLEPAAVCLFVCVSVMPHKAQTRLGIELLRSQSGGVAASAPPYVILHWEAAKDAPVFE